MLFSEYFEIDDKTMRKFDIYDISLDFDTPLFIDPVLIYLNNNPKIKKWYSNINEFVSYLYSKAIDGKTFDDVKHTLSYFKKEIRNNHLGLSVLSINGKSMNSDDIEHFYKNVYKIANNGITDSNHVEKICFFQKGIGEDKISDMITRLTFDVLLSYTQNIALNYIDENKRKVFRVDGVKLDSSSGYFVPQSYILPSYNNNFVLLTPKSILRKDSFLICLDNLYLSYDDVVDSIGNVELRNRVNTLFVQSFESVKADSKKRTRNTTIKRKTIDIITEQIPEIIDYFIKYVEQQSYVQPHNVQELEDSFNHNALLSNEFLKLKENEIKSKVYNSTFEEAFNHIMFFKNHIECKGLWKAFYRDKNKEKRVDEKFLQLLFSLSWYNSDVKLIPEANSGRGPSDFLITRGVKDNTVVEFKLASNSAAPSVYKELEVYMNSHDAKYGYVVFFYFDKEELKIIDDIIENNPDKKDITIKINCQKKLSASKVRKTEEI